MADEGLAVRTRWTSRLEAVLAEVGENLDDVLDEMAAAAVMEARERAPRLTGEMAASITIGVTRQKQGRRKRSRGRMSGGAGELTADTRRLMVASFPSAHLEFGTKKMRARPFMLPAVMAQKRRALLRIAQEGLV